MLYSVIESNSFTCILEQQGSNKIESNIATQKHRNTFLLNSWIMGGAGCLVPPRGGIFSQQP
jgi:hypothetical protein